MSCTKHPVQAIDDLMAAPDGIWKSTFGEASRLDPQSLESTLVVKFPEDILYSYNILPTEHGLWVDDLVNWGYYDGKDWSTFTMNRGSTISEIVASLYRSADGRVWFSGRDFVAGYDPSTGTGELFTYLQDMPQRLVIMSYNGDWFAAVVGTDADLKEIFDSGWQVNLDKTFGLNEIKDMPFVSSTEYGGTAPGPDGSIWIADAGGVYRYVPATGKWLEYDPREAGSLTFVFSSDIAVDPDGNAWVSDDRAVIELMPLSNTINDVQWRIFDARDGFEDNNAGHIAIDQQGMIWLVGSSSDNVLSQCQLAK
jgi:hypothetical protein